MYMLLIPKKAIEVEGSITTIGENKYVIYIHKKYSEEVKELKGQKVKIYIVVE